MRRGTPSAIAFGSDVLKIRNDAGLTCREVAERISAYPAGVSQVEKGQRVVKKDKIPLWANALEVDESYLRTLWLEADSLEEPPLLRVRAKSVKETELKDLIDELSGPERDRVLGYVTALIESRLGDSK